MNNKAVVVEWFDDINPESYVLCLEHYGIKILHEIEIDENKTEVTFYGPVDSINKFLADWSEDCVEPLEEMQSGDYDDEDYEAYLNNEVNRYFNIKNLDVFANSY